MRQPDEKLRELNREPTKPTARAQEVYCTKVGTTRPDEMYIVGAHMDGHGWGEAANDNGSGTALVMELARIFSMPDVQSPIARSASRCGTTKRPASTARAPTSISAPRCRARRIRPDRDAIRSRSGSA